MDVKLIFLAIFIYAISAWENDYEDPIWTPDRRHCNCLVTPPDEREHCGGNETSVMTWCLYDPWWWYDYGWYKRRNCCWDDRVNETYICYEPDPWYVEYPTVHYPGAEDWDCLRGKVNHSSRIKCPGSWKGMNQDQCNCLGCCYYETWGTPWCWKLDEH